MDFFATIKIYIENHTIDVISALQKEVNSLSQVTLQIQMVLDLFASLREVCTVTNTSCSLYIGQSFRASTDVQEIWKKPQICQHIAQDDSSGES